MKEECVRFEVRLMIEKTKHRRAHCAPFTSTIKHLTSNIPSGISLIEVLISMFVMLFGLMGVAALFPVGNFYAQKGEKYDLGAALGQAALDEMQIRGMLRPEKWLYADVPSGGGNPIPVIFQSGNNQGTFTTPLPTGIGASKKDHPGHAFVIDPLGRFAGISAGITTLLDPFPYWDSQLGKPNRNMVSTWRRIMRAANIIPGPTWPIRRLTLDINPAPYTASPMTGPVAETIFKLRDDLKFDQPKEDDHPAIQRWDVNDQGTPGKGDDVPLARQFQGNYSWLATIVPTNAAALPGLQPADPNYGQYDCDVSVVVFRKRDFTPSAESERLVDAQLLPGGEIVMYLDNNQNLASIDTALQDIRSGDWITVMGVHQSTGLFLMKWYRMLALEPESRVETFMLNARRNKAAIRRAMLAGPDWPDSSMNNLKVALLPGAISVVTKPMKMESDSLWGME